MLSLKDIFTQLENLDNWSFENNSINREFRFPDFMKSMEFVNRVAELAHKEDHHPSIQIDYNCVKLVLTTHSFGNVTEKDFEMARLIDGIDLDGEKL